VALNSYHHEVVILIYILRLMLHWCTQTAQRYSTNQCVVFYRVCFLFYPTVLCSIPYIGLYPRSF